MNKVGYEKFHNEKYAVINNYIALTYCNYSWEFINRARWESLVMKYDRI